MKYKINLDLFLFLRRSLSKNHEWIKDRVNIEENINFHVRRVKLCAHKVKRKQNKIKRWQIKIKRYQQDVKRQL